MRFTFYITDSELDRVAEIDPLKNPLHCIARGIASSPFWSNMPGTELQVRFSPAEITAVGSFDRADIARLKGLAWQTKHALQSLRYINYRDAEVACHRLVSNLEERIGSDQLKRCYFTALPRGGLIVLGMLSYLLELEPWQFASPPDPATPLVVVDDCALTGHRFKRFLKDHPKNPIIFAPLYSPPELRAAIEESESRVMACLSAHDLEECAYPGEDDGMTEQLRSHLQDRFWTGHGEYICFAWNEPDFTLWNPVTDRVEGGWTILPREVCLKAGALRVPVTIRPDVCREYRIADTLVVIQDEHCVMIDDIMTKERYSMKGVAAEMWNAFSEYGTRDAVLKQCLEEFEVDQRTLDHDLSDLVSNLLSRGILKAL